MKLKPKDSNNPGKPSCQDNLVIESAYNPLTMISHPTKSIREVRTLCPDDHDDENQSESSTEESFFISANQINITYCPSTNEKAANFQLRWEVVEDYYDGGYYDVIEEYEGEYLGVNEGVVDSKLPAQLAFGMIEENSG